MAQVSTALRVRYRRTQFARAAVLAFATAQITAAATRVELFPRLQPGQTLTYVISYRSQTQTKTKSPVSLAGSPGDVALSVRTLLRLEILEVAQGGPSKHNARATIRARAKLESLDPSALAGASNALVSTSSAVEFSILPDGGLDKVAGLDTLTPAEQHAWQQWAARFAASGAFPQGGIKPTQKWKSVEPERAPAPIAGLLWLREAQYVRNEPCHPLRLNDRGEFLESDKPAQTCAVILTTAALRQQSKPKDATPEDYRIRRLRTSGTARGDNQTILYISLTTGLVVRASDQADQSMSVTIAQADGSNHLHYDVDAKSVAEIRLVDAVPQTHL